MIQKASELWNGIASLSKQIHAAERERYELTQAWAVEVSPVKVGDLLAVPKDAFSYVGRPCRVLSVRGALRGDDPVVSIQARVIRKDGTDSVLDVRWSWVPGQLLPVGVVS